MILVFVLILLMLFAVAPLVSLPAKAEESAGKSEVETINAQPAATVTIFTEGFEGAWPGSWYVGDWDSRNGLDYWGAAHPPNTSFPHTGTAAAFCAEVGDHPNGRWYYDNYMQAYMLRPVSLSGYSSVTLSYWYWTQNEVTGGTQYDFLNVIYYSSGSYHYIDQHGGDSNGWKFSSVNIPTTATWVGFYFLSDRSNAAYYGSWVDDVVLTSITPTVDTVLNFGFTPNPVSPGTTVTLSGTLKTVGGSAVYPAQVTVDYSTDGGATWHYVWTLSTNAAGGFSQTFTAPGAGTYMVRVSYAGSATYNPSSHTETLTVGPAVWGDYHFRLSPYTDVIHIKISGGVIYGVAVVQGVGSDLPLLGYIQGSSFYIFIDVPDGLYGNEMSMMVGSTSTLSGKVYRTLDGKSWSGGESFSLVSASSASGSSVMGEASAVEPQSWPATYNFQISPWPDIVRLSVDGSVIHGTDESSGSPPYHDQPVLGYVSGSFFILGIDWTKDDSGNNIYYELGIIRASTSTMSGYMYRTIDGKSFTSGPTISFVSVSP
jgi:hypothetical protein